MIYAPSETINVNLNCDLSGYSKKVTSITLTFSGTLILSGADTIAKKIVEKHKKEVIIPVTGSKVTD